MSNEQTAADIARIESMYGDRDSFLKAFPEAERLRVSGFIDSYPEEDRDRVRMKMANVQLLATAFKLSTDETIDRYDQLQASYAQQVLKQDSPMDMDEVKFHGLVQQRVEKRKALRTKGDAIESAMVEAFTDEARPDFDKTFTRIVGEKQKAGVILDADETAELRQTLANRWSAMANDEETYGNAIGATVAYFNKNKGATVNTVTHEQQAALMALNGLDRNAQEFVMQKAAHLAKVTAADAEKEGGWSKFIKRSGRAISDLDRYAAQAVGQIGAKTASVLEEDNPALAAQDKAANKFFDLERRMSNALQGYVDPAKGNSWISESLIAAGSNAPRMALALTPPGLVVNALAYKTELEGNLLDRGLTQEQASKLSMIGAPVMAALDYAEVGFAFKGWVPGGKTLTGKFANQFLKAGTVGVLQTGQQLIQETGQDLVAPALQSIGSVLSSEIPEVQWMDKDGKPGEWSKTWSNMPNTFQALLPYILLGTGKNRWDAGFNERFQGWTRQYLTAAGYDAQTVKDAMAAPDAEAAQKVLIAGFDKRDITTPAAQAAIAATNERMQQMAASLTPPTEVAASLTVESPDYVPSVAVSFRHSETGLDVLDENGEIVAKTSSPQEAAMVALRYQKNQAAINEATAFAESKVPLPEGSTIQVHVMPDGKRFATVNVMLDPNSTDPNLAGESMELQQAKDAGYDVPNIPENTPQGDYTTSQLISGNIPEEAPAQAKETNYEEEYLKLDKAHIDKYREDMGLEAVETPEVRKHIVLMEQAKVNDPSGMATDALAQSLLVKPQPVTDTQHAAFVKRMIDVTNAHKQAMRLATEAYDGGNFAEAKRQFAVADALVEQYDVLLRAKRLAGTETGRALSVIRMAASLKTYDLVNVVTRMQSASGKKLDPDLLKELQRVTKELEDAKAKLEALEKQDAKDSEQQQKDDTDAFVEQAKAGKKPATRNDKRKFGRKPKKLTREELITKLAELGFDPVNGGEVTPAVADVIAKLAEINVEEGAKTLSDIDGRIKQDIPAVSEDTIHQAMAGKIAEEATPKKELNRQLEEFKKQAGLWADIHAILESGEVDSGKSAAIHSEKVGQLKEILAKLRLNALKEERDNAKFLDLAKRFDEVQDRLTRGFRDVRDLKAEEDGRIAAARDALADVRRRLGLTDIVYDLEDRLRRMDFSTPERADASVSAEVAALQEKVKGLRKQLREAKKEAERPGKEAEAEAKRLKDLSETLAEVDRLWKAQARAIPADKDAREQSKDEQQLRKKIEELKRLMNAEDVVFKLEDKLRSLDFAKPGPRPTVDMSAEMKAIKEREKAVREAIKEEKRKIAEAKKEADKLDALLAKLEDAKRNYADKTRSIPDAKKEQKQNEVIKQTKEQIRELEQLMSVQDSIYTMEEHIRRNEPPTHKRRKEESDELFTAHLRQRELRRDIAKIEENYIFKSLSLADKSVKRISETGEFLRSAKATADFSAAFRQAVFLAPKRPIAFTTAFVKAARAFFDSNYAEQIDYNMRRQPQQIYRDRANLYLSSIDGKMTGREESFRSALIERIPGFGSIARGSNRNMVVMLNLMRAEAFDSFMKSHPDATAQTRNMMARYINIATGRGELGKLEPSAEFLAKFAFSPRFVASRIELLGSPFYFAVKDRTVAKEVMKDWLAFHATGMAVLALASMAGARVGEEPEKHTFGKIQFGPLIIDIWGGLQQPASLTIKAVAAAADNHGAYELEKDINMLDAGLRFLAYKASPGVTVPYTALFGRDFMGNKVTLEEAIARSVIPMTIETFGEVYDKTDSAGWASFAAGLSFVGVGVQVEKKKQYRR